MRVSDDMTLDVFSSFSSLDSSRRFQSHCCFSMGEVHESPDSFIPSLAPKVYRPQPEAQKVDANILSPVTSYSRQPNISASPGRDVQNKSILRFRRSTFWLAVALGMAIIAIIVTAVAVSEVNGRHCKSPTCEVQHTNTTNVPTMTAIMTTAAFSPGSSTPSSDCLHNAGQDYSSHQPGLVYTKVCNASLSSQDQYFTNLMAAYQPTFDLCIGM